MTEFLAKENECGQSMLKLASRGSAILAELQRLSQNIPKIFYENQSDNNQKYSEVLFDFQYLNSIDEFEDKIQSNIELVELDNRVNQSYVELLERFYTLFESIFIYYQDVQEIMQEIFDGVFIQYSFENLLQNIEGRKLMTELFYMYGVMLILLDKQIPGPIREKIIIAFYRYRGGLQAINNINEVCKLCKSTGFLPESFTGAKEERPEFYPEDYFGRFSFDEKMMEAIVNVVKDGDMYESLTAYPAPEHRSFGLSQQGAILFVLLFFVPDILNDKKAKMREIVDRHFYDNWVINFYIGYHVDLTVEWKPYKAAKLALANTLDFEYIEELSAFFQKSLDECYQKCQNFLIDGVLTEEYTLEKSKQLLNCVRQSNITVRWLMLHQKSRVKGVREIILNGLKQKDILSLLLVTSSFENKLTQMLEKLLEQKQERWDADKKQCYDKMNELSEYFGGARGLGQVQNDDSFKIWFAEMRDQINNLAFGDEVYTGGKINKLIKALDDIEQYQMLNSNYVIKHYLEETKKDLKHMTKISNISPTLLAHISLISDISYSWKCLPDYINMMQEKIKKHPQLALLLKSTFIKLSCILNSPMVRILQAESPDINSVSKYYSQELIKFVKNVLQIIPAEVFSVLESVIVLLSEKIVKIPTKFSKADFKNLTQYEERYDMAKNNYRISLLTESILSMEKYLIGVIEVNPKEILDEGIRKELIKLICKILNRVLVFKEGTVEEFNRKLQQLSENLEGFKTSVEYIQDFISTYGLKTFHEEFDRLITCYIDMEQNAFLTGNIEIEDMLYDEDIPMPDLEKNRKMGSVNFMGRLLNQILNLTDGKKAVYIEHSMGFYEINTGREIFTLKTLGLLYRCIGVSGLNGLDKFLGFNISTTMKGIVKTLKKHLNFDAIKNLKDTFNELKNITAFNDRQDQLYKQLTKNFGGLLQKLVKPIMRVGQMILLRKIICLQLQLMAKVGSKRLYLCLENLNNGILNDVTNRVYDQQMSQEDIAKENELIYESTKLCTYIGMTDPFKKIYLTPDFIEGFPLLMYVTTSIIIPHCDYDSRINTIIRKNPSSQQQQQQNNNNNQNQNSSTMDSFQPAYFMHGIIALLQQFHPNNKDIYLGFLSHQIKSQLNKHQQANYNVQQQQNSKQQQQQQQQNSSEQLADMFLYITFYDHLLHITGDAKQSQVNQMVPIELINTNFTKDLKN